MVSTDTYRTIILRLSGELCIKSPQVRRRFQDRLLHNIRMALENAGITEYKLIRHWSRMDVEVNDPRAPEILARVYGIQGVIPAYAYPWETLEDIVEIGERLYREKVVGKTFAVRSKRVGNRGNIPFASMDLGRALGSSLHAQSAGVDLDNPEVVVGVEVRENNVFFLDDELVGPGGLPMGSEGKAVALMSGGFDSAVAAYMMQKRGIDLDFIFFNLGGPAHERGVRDVTKMLCERWSNGYQAKFHIVDLRPIVADMKDNVSGSYWQLLLKRLMMRASHMICEEEGYPAMITGESAGQVSSQTLMNLAAIQTSVLTPILRPLVGLNKEDIIALARIIGTHDLSADVPEFCALDGGRPVTNGSAKRLDREEERVSRKLLESLVEHRKTLKVCEMRGGADMLESDLEVDSLVEGAVMIDLRTSAARSKWKVPDAVEMDFDTAVGNVAYLPKEATYLLLCDVGLKSAFLADMMRKMGFKAHSFRRGTRALRRHLETMAA
ncbi:tRNA uracil 4-sulfurtransferase ThiI [Bradymonas sediminis]|uniref:tRNA uracil 4-sulfurtransferase ThiI n=1 Tax=Bradymonas sediminis TaxID=1548548 RepID=UPI0010F1C28C|nr:tRNA uracil 4-sulfurtransferase ThiI [Bradymonas sediminis]TDP72102.1 thiamine biosynthesis protein ThiI [Bradymonas sediminis]